MRKKMLLFCLLVLCLKLVGSIGVEYDFFKCCSSDKVMKYQNFSYRCDGDDGANNVQIINPSSGALNVSEDICVEVLDQGVVLFQVVAPSEEFSKLLRVSPSFRSKCCPMGYIYNAHLHACEENHFDHDDWPYRFFRIGLPNCKIIFDYKTRDFLNPDFFDIKTENYCIDKAEDDFQIVRVCVNDLEICKTTKCIHKCCPDGRSFVNGSVCKPTYVHGVDLNFSEYIEQTDDFGIIHGYTGKIYLQPPHWEFRLDANGVFRLFDEKIGNGIYEAAEKTYCIEHATKHGIDLGHRVFRMYPDEAIEKKYIINGYVMIVSGVCLLLTIIFYIFTGETKKLFGKTLVSFCVCLLVTFILLIYSTFNLENIKSNTVLCRTLGFLLLYGEFSTFLWLKLLCFDIYCTFGSGKIRSEFTKTHSIKRFVFYSLYGWGIPLVLTSIPIGFSYVDILPEQVQIIIGLYRCSIDRVEGNYADILFRTVPITILQTVNFFLFVKTVNRCMEVKNEIRKMNDNNGSKKSKKFLLNKERLMLVIKLSIIMGITYVFEVVSSFYDFNQTRVTKYVEIVWDIINCLQGVFIFAIFICKRKMLNQIKDHAGVKKLRKISFSSGVTLTTTSPSEKERKKRTLPKNVI